MNFDSNLKSRTLTFALEIVRMYSQLPRTTECQVIGKQLLKSGTSVGAHYREGCRAKSDADFISKIEGALQELEETSYWLELLVNMKVANTAKLESTLNECSELTSIMVSIVKKIKNK